MPAFTTAAAVNVLIEGLERLADVIRTPMPTRVALLDDTGPRPILWLDVGGPGGSPDEDLGWAVLEALAALAFGPDQAGSARHVRRLHLVG